MLSEQRIATDIYELSRLRRNFFDRINPPEVWRVNRINMIFLFSLYLPAGRQVLDILSILSKKENSYTIKITIFIKICPVEKR